MDWRVETKASWLYSTNLLVFHCAHRCADFLPCSLHRLSVLPSVGFAEAPRPSLAPVALPFRHLRLSTTHYVQTVYCSFGAKVFTLTYLSYSS